MQLVGVVVIGRNEGNRLKDCLLSVIGEQRTIVYVDSGSTDGSPSTAKTLGVNVIELDLSIPFTAARARNAGCEYLWQIKPEIEFVQFVDGDCRVAPGWFPEAIAKLVDQPEVVVVCGRRREEFPQNSIYNRLCDIEWDTPVGEAKSCGGDAMLRLSAFQQVQGFNPTLIAGEEPELCLRLRQQGGKILRIDADMTWHDARITRFGQWWKRMLRGGHAYAEGSWLHGGTDQKHWVKETRSIWLWGFFAPLLALMGAWITKGLSLVLLLIVYGYLSYRVYQEVQEREITPRDALFYSLSCILGKIPQMQGQLQFHLSRLLKRQRSLVEYKSTTK